jgi:hypothetical protein
LGLVKLGETSYHVVIACRDGANDAGLKRKPRSESKKKDAVPDGTASDCERLRRRLID